MFCNLRPIYAQPIPLHIHQTADAVVVPLRGMLCGSNTSFDVKGNW